MKLVEFEPEDASHLVILKNRGLAEVHMGNDGSVSAQLTDQGAQLATKSIITRNQELPGDGRE